MLERFAGDRFGQLDVVLAYSGPDTSVFTVNTEEIRDDVGNLEELGVGWAFVSPPWSTAPGPAERLQGFAETFFSPEV